MFVNVMFWDDQLSQRTYTMAKVLDCDIVVSDFELQSRYYVHYQTITLGKGMNALISPAIG